MLQSSLLGVCSAARWAWGYAHLAAAPYCQGNSNHNRKHTTARNSKKRSLWDFFIILL